jgi:hypothetical protein
MGASVKTIDKHYGHLARDSEQAIRDRLDARAARTAMKWRRAATNVKAAHGKRCRRAGTTSSASDGTRTRDLRRDRPCQPKRRETPEGDDPAF